MATKGKKLNGLNPKYDTPEELEKCLKEIADRKKQIQNPLPFMQFSLDFQFSIPFEVDDEQWRYEVKSLLLEETLQRGYDCASN